MLPDEATEETDAVLDATATHDVWAPALWPLEIANLLIRAARRRRLSAARREQLALVAAELRVRIDREPVSIATIDALGARYDLTAYDAAYLELALRRRLPLVTRDVALMKAMAKAGVSSEWS